MDDGIARMGEVVFSRQGLNELKALGLGSCIGLCIYDPVTKNASLAHIMLPEARTPDTPEKGKYADTAVPFVIEEMMSRGASKTRLKAAIVGGAQLFSFQTAGDRLDVGRRNTEAVKTQLKKLGIKIVAEDTGGNAGRTVVLDTQTGRVYVKSVGNETVLTDLAA